ncbi:unnamed protein product, partial [Rotaria sp. Silwood1]
MDGTDEQFSNNIEKSRICPFQPDHFNCDEALFHSRYFSCGDGQFLDERSRHEKVVYNYDHAADNEFRFKKADDYCANYRDKNYACEEDEVKSMWTMAVNGHCLVHGGSTMPPDTDEQLCLFYTKCLMAHGGKLHEKCHCNGYDCSDNYHRYCKRGPISYPGGRLWKPYLNLLLVYDMSEYTPYPFRVTFEFKYSVKCNGFQGFSDNFELL